MEELIGLVIFGVIAAISGLAKLQEQRKEEEARKQRANRKGVEDLPEATRRMLYGDGGPPVARRRGEGPPTIPPVATPRQQTAPPAAPQRRPVPQRSEGIPTATPRQQTPPPPQRRQAPSAPRPVAQPQPQRKQSRDVLAMPEAQRPSADYQESAIVASEHAKERARAVEDAIRDEARYRSTDAPKQPVAKQAQRPSQAELFRNLARNHNALRASLITMEVIGPPKALREG